MRKFLLPIALYLLCAANGDCQYFSTITVPPADTDGAPSVFDTLCCDNGQHRRIVSNTEPPIVYRLQPGEVIFAGSSALDGSGIRELKTFSTFSKTCCAYEGGERICSHASPLSTPSVERQAGGVGSSVSNGLWRIDPVRAPVCNPGWDLASYAYSWHTEATDFHGRRTVGPTHVIYAP